MQISKKFGQGKTVFSLEVFPPKKDSPVESIYRVLGELTKLKPDFISVTYGAGGNAADHTTCDIASYIQTNYGIDALTHLTCVNSTKEDMDTTLEYLKNQGVMNILALRGDKNPEIEPKKDFTYASSLVEYIKTKGDFHLSGACYPEIHIEASSMEEDLEHLKYKVDCGAEHLISQLFFDNDYFFDFLEKARKKGITVPIEAGIMPVVNKRQIERMVTMCGASIPSKLAKILQRYEHQEEALRDAGIAYAVEQIMHLVASGVDGIHLYTMNNAYIATKIHEAIFRLL
ncbi:MAG TPA: methylenetetrahydrofolate reductase [NAD(P)H], partial [Lachnoclostridium phytofermentans]|nr:methylenetetrahydrofolate reductase [NAD(P)H] [Lachnoclostridium sp.]HCL03933.1 methylenetetrahydrofolate reductase [NAD(P)H] [Lachnoclostridium phytofermentans]